MEKSTWRELITRKMGENDSFEHIVAISPHDLDLDKKFDCDYGLPEGEPFVLWTEEWVYFPICHDGAEWVERVPRNPGEVKARHFGGY